LGACRPRRRDSIPAASRSENHGDLGRKTSRERSKRRGFHADSCVASACRGRFGGAERARSVGDHWSPEEVPPGGTPSAHVLDHQLNRVRVAARGRKGLAQSCLDLYSAHPFTSLGCRRAECVAALARRSSFPAHLTGLSSLSCPVGFMVGSSGRIDPRTSCSAWRIASRPRARGRGPFRQVELNRGKGQNGPDRAPKRDFLVPFWARGRNETGPSCRGRPLVSGEAEGTRTLNLRIDSPWLAHKCL